MPVQFDTYNEDVGRIDLSDGSNAHSILSFLADHPEKGFTPSEIHDEHFATYTGMHSTIEAIEERFGPEDRLVAERRAHRRHMRLEDCGTKDPAFLVRDRRFHASRY